MLKGLSQKDNGIKRKLRLIPESAHGSKFSVTCCLPFSVHECCFLLFHGWKYRMINEAMVYTSKSQLYAETLRPDFKGNNWRLA
jgi:hypothetical protein